MPKVTIDALASDAQSPDYKINLLLSECHYKAILFLVITLGSDMSLCEPTTSLTGFQLYYFITTK